MHVKNSVNNYVREILFYSYFVILLSYERYFEKKKKKNCLTLFE